MRLKTSILALATGWAMTSGAAFANEPAPTDHWFGGEYQNCDGSTVDMMECIGELGDKWDSRLNDAYKRVLADQEGSQQQALRHAQRQWVAYRDANCAFYAGGDGSIARLETATCTYVLTRDRAQELEMMLQE
jgi:uncharacterized protein YecT (DUF1311 family)